MVGWLLQALMGEHRATCPHFDKFDKSKCPTEKVYEEAQRLVEAG